MIEKFSFLSQSGALVFEPSKASNVAPVMQKLVTLLDVAPWGEDNRFPQNIVHALEGSGVAQSTLAWKAKSIWGSGLVYGTVQDIDSEGSDTFKIAKLGDYPMVDEFFSNNNIPRFFAEFCMDLVYFGNCFPEMIFDNARQNIAALIHQESADCRFKQMDDNGAIDTVFLSKLWGMTADQYVKFDAKRALRGLTASIQPTAVDGKYVKQLPACDMYFPMSSVTKLKESGVASFIFPVNYPSPNKTYYQLASWDGCRRSGWIEISAKVPEMVKMAYQNAFNIRYHIEIPATYFENKYGAGEWSKMSKEKRDEARKVVLEQMDSFLSGSENAYKTFTSYFDIDPITKQEFGHIKITPVDTKNNTDKDLLTSGTANSEIMFAMGVNPNILGAGTPGGVYASNQGGSNIREGKLEHDSSLHLERQLALEPLNFIKKFNGWPADLEFRFKDTVLTTLDTGKQSQQQIN